MLFARALSNLRRGNHVETEERRPGHKAQSAGSPGNRRNDERSSHPPKAVRPVAARETVREATAPAASERPLKDRTGDRPHERVPVILESLGAGDFHLIDSGTGLKLEQYGPYRIVRPEGQALWQPSLASHVWEKVDAIFTGDTDEEGTGRWRFPKEALGETWPLNLLGVDFMGALPPSAMSACFRNRSSIGAG